MSLMDPHWAKYQAERQRLAASHDDGAGEALRDALDLTVECGSYCYGGTARCDIPETLAELAEAGWRLVRPASERK
jgi:hypothetical protein